MKIRSVLNRGEFAPTNNGDKYRYNYKRVQADDGSWYLVETDRIDIVKEINSQIPPSILDIINRARRGDDTLLNARTGEVYEDVSKIPSNFGDVLKVGVSSKTVLDSFNMTVTDNTTHKESEEVNNG